VVTLATLGETVEEHKVMEKILCCVPSQLKQITLVISTLLDVESLIVPNLEGRLKAVEKAFEEPPSTLQQDGRLYLTEEEWDVCEAKNLSAGSFGGSADKGGRGGGRGDRGRGRGWGHRQGVRQQLTAPYSPEQNGVVEHCNTTIVGAARSMLKAKGLPNQFWGEAVFTVVYILNRTPTRSVEGAIP
jgi:hypothetical protein